MKKKIFNLLLADDDEDDCMFFEEAVTELPCAAELTVVNDGEHLMDLLHQKLNYLPDVLFLDLNMPRKTGIQCLSEIKENENLKDIPVIIYSTSYDKEVANLLYENGAHYYIRKPTHFSKIKKAILETLKILSKELKKPNRENFVIQV